MTDLCTLARLGSEKRRLVSIALAASLLEETAYLRADQDLRGLPVADVVRDVARNVEGLVTTLKTFLALWPPQDCLDLVR